MFFVWIMVQLHVHSQVAYESVSGKSM